VPIRLKERETGHDRKMKVIMVTLRESRPNQTKETESYMKMGLDERVIMRFHNILIRDCDEISR
jgi:hypothetical protein